MRRVSDDLGQGDWQDAVQALRNDRQGPPSAFDALATGVDGVLGESDRRWQALADLSADWYWETDPQHRLVRLFGSVCGAAPARLGRPTTSSAGATTRSRSFARRGPAAGGRFHARARARRSPFATSSSKSSAATARALRHVAVSGRRAHRRAAATFAGYEGVGRDVTERKRAMARLQASEQRWATMVGLASDWYWETDAQHRVLPLTPELHRRFGAARRATRGPHALGSPPRRLSPEQWAEHRADLEARRPFRSLQMVIDGADREAPMWVSLSGVPRTDAAGQFRGYHGVGRDITARKQAERVLMRHNETLQRAVAEHTRELQQVNRDLDAFARQLAHELRTPIGHVQGLAHLLSRAPESRPADEDRHLLDMQVAGGPRHARHRRRPAEPGAIDDAADASPSRST